MNWQQISGIISNILLLSFISVIPVYGLVRKVDIFPSFVKGARQGILVGIRILPYLVGFLVALGMFRAAGGFQLLAHWFGGAFSHLGFPAELLPLAVVRPFSGSAANGVFADIAQSHGGHSFLAHAAATMMGSTETTFYVILVYFGSIGIRRTRHAVPAGLIADTVGIIVAVWVTHWLYA